MAEIGTEQPSHKTNTEPVHADHEQPDGERERGDDFQAAQRFKTNTPEFFSSPIEATPCMTVQKMIGAIIFLMSLMKPSPKGFSAFPYSGKCQPIPTATA